MLRSSFVTLLQERTVDVYSSATAVRTRALHSSVGCSVFVCKHSCLNTSRHFNFQCCCQFQKSMVVILITP